MRTATPKSHRKDIDGSTFIIVLWIAFGLVAMTLYFANSMSLELRASDNRVCGLAAEQAIEGASRYISYLLANQIAYGSNGFAPDSTMHLSEAVKVGEAHFWLIGSDTNSSIGPPQIAFGLVDEASKINVNTASSNTLTGLLASLPRANQDLAAAILDWRDTNGGNFQTYYAMQHPAYESKSAPLETVDELRLVYGGDMDTLIGEDANRNGILDPGEDKNRDGQLDPGVLEYVTVYSREPNTATNGSPLVNVRTLTSFTTGPLNSLLQTNLSSSRADQILSGLGLTGNGPAGPGGNRPGNPPAGGNVILISASPLQFYSRCHEPPASMTSDEFAKIANYITVSSSTNYIEGRVNVNTASATVLASLPGINASPDLAQTLINYRQMNADKLTSIAWVLDAIGQNNATALQALMAEDCITTQSYVYTADVAAVGPHGRGYRRVRFVFDTCDGIPKIVYRQDLTHLGWALGSEVRKKLLLAGSSR